MIKEYCPDGVQYQRIGDLADYEQPGKYIVDSTNYNDSFETPVLTAGQSFILGYTDETKGIYQASPDYPVIIFDDFTGAFKWVDFPFKVKSSAMKLLTAKEDVATLRYIYHLMGFLNYSSDEHKRLWISLYSEFQVPVPPLEVQREIVRILDNFTDHTEKLKAELASELTARKKQYEFYRDELLSFGKNGAERKFLSEIAEISTGSSNTEDAEENGIYPFYVRSQEPLKKNTFEYDEEAIITAGDGVGVGKVFHYVNGKYALHQRAYRIHPASPDIHGKYLFYYFSTKFPVYIAKTMYEGSVPSIRRPMLNKFEVDVPDLETQKKVVAVLDNFDAICFDLNIGLPAEIEARKLQYEYYRDLLLSFGSQFVHVEREREVTRARKPD